MPHGQGIADGFFITTRDIITAKTGPVRRYRLTDDYDLDVKLTPDHGYLLIKLPSRKLSDTVYSQLSGMELQVLRRPLPSC